MVRVNVIKPRNLTDQHLVAEYLEILMLVTYIKKHPKLENIPKNYCLGKGHMKFFKNKLKYLKLRYEKIKKEMRKRGFLAKKSLKISNFNKKNLKNWKPKKQDKEIIKKRLIQKINKKPKFYKYYKKYKPKSFLINLVKKA